MEGASYSVGVLTVSDRVSQGTSEDKSGPVLKDLIEAGLKGAKVVATAVIPDEIPRIQEVTLPSCCILVGDRTIDLVGLVY